MAVDTTSANPHESHLIQRLFDFMLPPDRLEEIIGDKVYGGDDPDGALAQEGIEMIAPHRRNRNPDNVARDRRPLLRYARRWTRGRTINWIQDFRPLCVR